VTAAMLALAAVVEFVCAGVLLAFSLGEWALMAGCMFAWGALLGKR
jgi:hypothetical protein